MFWENEACVVTNRCRLFRSYFIFGLAFRAYSFGCSKGSDRGYQGSSEASPCVSWLRLSAPHIILFLNVAK